jgi:UDP-glucose 4-epimerase
MEEVSVGDLARQIKALSGSSSPIEVVEYEAIYGSRFEDMQRRVPDLAKIRALVGYQPEVSLDQLLVETIEHVRAKRDLGAPAATSLR